MLGDQVRQQTKKSQQAVQSRQQLEDQVKCMDNLIKECEDSADGVIGIQVPVTEKIEKLKVGVRHYTCRSLSSTVGWTSYMAHSIAHSIYIFRFWFLNYRTKEVLIKILYKSVKSRGQSKRVLSAIELIWRYNPFEFSPQNR
mgnify:CR=1 FL=1